MVSACNWMGMVELSETLKKSECSINISFLHWEKKLALTWYENEILFIPAIHQEASKLKLLKLYSFKSADLDHLHSESFRTQPGKFFIYLTLIFNESQNNEEIQGKRENIALGLCFKKHKQDNPSNFITPRRNNEIEETGQAIIN